MITSYMAPMPNQKVILTDYEAKKKTRVNQDSNDAQANLEPPMIREFAIHILQTIHFL
jgi:hypothetical protein